ncbi:uncharacterized protein LOC143234499 isoform X3 [Tachypleus tridentatus]|uniref:uncharacterized protein LOC143234499 isoform X3 n=1 Tax=Tachypleus tridentatus TaxID=6853 RepID=UPI003FD4C8B8
MFCWLQKAAPVTVASWLLSELQKTEGIQKCRDPYQGVLVVSEFTWHNTTRCFFLPTTTS